MAPSKKKEVGGYNVILAAPFPKKYKCPFCNLLMRDPIQTYRGEMACESCYIDAKGDEDVCPIDHEPIEDGEFFKDMHARREVLQLESFCPNKKLGCSWQGVISEFLKDHYNECLFNAVTCIKCHEVVLHKDMEQHDKKGCRYRQVTCPHCKETYDAESLQEHESSCHLKPLLCPYSCGQRISLNLLYDHVERCPMVMKGNTCPYQIVGCKHKPKNNADLKDHLQASNNAHAAFTLSLVMYLRQDHDKMKQELMKEISLCAKLSQKLEEHAKVKSRMEIEMERIHIELCNLQKERETMQENFTFTIDTVKEHLKEIDLRTSLPDIDERLNEITSKYNVLEAKLNSGTPGACSGASTIDSEEVKLGIGKIDQLERGSAVLSANLSDLELKLQLLENTCYEGRQLWKVDNATYRMNQAVTGKVTALHSAPCFQKRGGYKFCLRLYLNGDGMGRGTHVSLFFVVMKSEYDALLQWPFSERVTFRLINPHNREESVVESFVPDRNSSSFKRPAKDMNIAAGCPMFIRKENLFKFIVDDVFYIESLIGSDTIH